MLYNTSAEVKAIFGLQATDDLELTEAEFNLVENTIYAFDDVRVIPLMFTYDPPSTKLSKSGFKVARTNSDRRDLRRKITRQIEKTPTFETLAEGLHGAMDAHINRTTREDVIKSIIELETGLSPTRAEELVRTILDTYESDLLA